MKILFTLFILWLLPFAFTSFYNHPAIDDYWNANAINMYGKIGAVRYFYHTVSGRYTSLFIMSFCNTLPKGEVWIFKVFPLIIIVLLLCSFYFFYTSFFIYNGSQAKPLLLSCLFVVCHIAGMRSLFEGLYWMSSTVGYQVAICLFAIGVGAIVRDIKKPNLMMRIVAIASCLLLPGTVEMVIPVYFFTLVLLLYFSYQFQYAKSTIIVCLLITFILGFLVIVSKGNMARVEKNSVTYNVSILTALGDCAKSMGYYTTIYLFNPLFLSAVLIVGFWYGSNNKLAVVLNKTDFIAVLCYFVASGLAVYLPLHLLESSIPFPRVTTLFFVVFFHAGLFFVFYNSATIFKLLNKIKIVLKRSKIKTALLALLVVSAFTTKNFVLVYKDLINGTSKKYNIESCQRYNAIKACKSDTCFVPPHRYWPYFAQSSKDKISDPNHFQHMNVYFKKTILFR